MKGIKRVIVLCLALFIASGCLACGGNGDEGGGEEGAASFPCVRISFDAAAPESKEDGYVSAHIAVDGCEAEYAFSDVEADVKIRGNSTATADKKPYRIKFDKKRGMLGLNGGAKCKSWVLLADAFDYSMSRNYFMLGLGNVFDNVYCSDRSYVNVYIDGEYNGVYLLTEQNQVNPNRIDVDEDNVETSENTGYFLELDDGRADSEATLFDDNVTAEDISRYSDYYFEVKFRHERTAAAATEKRQIVIKSDLAVSKSVRYAQLKKISEFVQAAYTAMFDYADEYTIRSLIDIPTAVDMFIINSFATTKVGGLSEFMYVDFTAEEPRLCFGAPWDFDLDLNNYGSANYIPQALRSIDSSSNLFYPLSQCDWFMREVRSRWTETRAYEKVGELVNELDPHKGKAICNVYKDEFARNYDKWRVWGEKQSVFQSDRSKNYTCHKDAVSELHSWVKAKLEYLNTLYI